MKRQEKKEKRNNRITKMLTTSCGTTCQKDALKAFEDLTS